MSERDKALLQALEAIAEQIGRTELRGYLSGPTPLENAIARFERAINQKADDAVL